MVEGIIADTAEYFMKPTKSLDSTIATAEEDQLLFYSYFTQGRHNTLSYFLIIYFEYQTQGEDYIGNKTEKRRGEEKEAEGGRGGEEDVKGKRKNLEGIIGDEKA